MDVGERVNLAAWAEQPDDPGADGEHHTVRRRDDRRADLGLDVHAVVPPAAGEVLAPTTEDRDGRVAPLVAHRRRRHAADRNREMGRRPRDRQPDRLPRWRQEQY